MGPSLQPLFTLLDRLPGDRRLIREEVQQAVRADDAPRRARPGLAHRDAAAGGLGGVSVESPPGRCVDGGRRSGSNDGEVTHDCL